jgi:hypothetical protein
MAGCFGLDRCGTRGFFTSWLIVGIRFQSALGQPPVAGKRETVFKQRIRHLPGETRKKW